MECVFQGAGVEATAEAEGGSGAEVVWHKGVPLTCATRLYFSTLVPFFNPIHVIVQST